MRVVCLHFLFQTIDNLIKILIRGWLRIYWNPVNYRAFALIPQGPTQQKPWRPCWCSRQKRLIKILLNWNTNMATVTSCANALKWESFQFGLG